MAWLRVLWQTIGTPTHNEQVMLDLTPNQPVIRGARLRLVEDRRKTYELVSIPAQLLIAGTSTLQDLRQLAAANRLRLGKSNERLSQVAADRILAKHLEVARGSTVKMLDRITLSDTGIPIEWRIAFSAS